jgi:translation initiation factor IF-2
LLIGLILSYSVGLDEPAADVAIQVNQPVREHDVVYRLVEGSLEPALG